MDRHQLLHGHLHRRHVGGVDGVGQEAPGMPTQRHLAESEHPIGQGAIEEKRDELVFEKGLAIDDLI